MGKEIQVRIVLRHNTTAGWAEVEEKEVLRKGEIGLEFNQSSNIPKMKIGDGVKPWKGLPYFSADLPETFNWGLLKGTLFEGETEKIEEGSFAGLTKPAYKDNADISVINKNFDILKTNIEELQNKTSSIESTISDIDETKVDKVSGKGLSTNDYTTDEKNKLAGIATGATKVIVDSALSSTSTNAIQNKVVANMKNEIDNALEEKLDINGNAATATKATQDSAGQQINTTYIKGLSINGKTITYTKGDGTTETITTQDTNTTYSAGTGLSLSGTTFNHSNSVTAATAQGDASKTLTFGDTFTIPTITYDAQGHITGKGTTTMTMPVGPVAKEGNPVSEIGIAGTGFSVKTTFEPKQEGSGDPYPSGGGKNKISLSFPNGVTTIKNTDGSITATNNTGSSTAGPSCVLTGALPAGTYTFTFYSGKGEAYIQSSASDYTVPVYIGQNHTFSYDGISYLRIIYSNISSGETVTYKAQLEAGSTATEYAPYENIRPISGRTDATLTRCGKNLLSKAAAGTQTKNGITFTSNGDGSYTINGTSTGSGPIQFAIEVPITIPAGAYLHLGNTGALNNNIAFVPHLTDGTTISLSFTVENRVWKINDDYIGKTINAIGIYVNGVQTADITFKPMICMDATPGAFEPYQGNTYSADFGQTVYGGTLDWLTGVLTVDWAYKALDGTEAMSYNANVNGSGYGRFGIGDIVSGILPASSANLNLICSHYKTDALPIGNNQTSNAISGYRDTATVYIRDDAYTSTEAYKAYLSAQYAAGTPVQIAYKLATPITIQLPPQDLRMLDGTNTVYSDGTTNYVIFNSGASSLGKAYELFFKKTDTISVSNGGTGATSASGARTNLEVPSKTGDGASGTWGISVSGNAATATLASYVLKMQTYKQGSTTETYGTSYPLYAQWESSNVLKLKCDNYTVKTDTATKLATARTLTIGNTGKIFDGSGNVSWSLSEIGAAAASHGTHVTNSTVQVFNRDTIGTSPNFDNPGVNGFFEVRITSETSGETGTKPFNSFGTFLNLRTPDHIAMLQLAAPTGGELMFRAKQAAGVTMSEVAWKTLLSSSNYNSYSPTLTGVGASGTWGISVSGNAATATKLANARTIQTNLGSTSSASFNGTANITPGVTGTLAVANGGTGATSKSGARTNLGITSGTTLPSSGTSGDIFFLY